MNSRKKKIYAVVLGVAVVFLIVDRWLLDTPSAASAALTSVLMPRAAESASPAGNKPSASILQEVMFPRELPQPSWDARRRNPFDLPLKIALRRDQRLTGGSEGNGQPAARKPGEPLTVVQFVKVHRLKGIMLGDPAVAIVDDQAIEVGQKFDDSTLLKIEGGKAHFQCLDGTATLTIDQNPDQ